MADQSGKKSKRIVKNPETFRERALKASEAADNPNQGAKLKRAGGKVGTPVSQPLKRTASRLNRFKLFRIISKVIFPVYLRHSWRELRLVSWPGWAESRRLTYAVLVFAVIFGAAIAGVDWGLDKVFKSILLK